MKVLALRADLNIKVEVDKTSSPLQIKKIV